MNTTTRRAVSAHVRYQGRDQYVHRHTPTPLNERIAPMQSPSHGHREMARRFERLVTTSAIVGVLLLVAYHAVRYVAGVL